MQAIWENQFYYMFGFLFLVFIILIISCSQISIVMVYFQLCGEVSWNVNRGFGSIPSPQLTSVGRLATGRLLTRSTQILAKTFSFLSMYKQVSWCLTSLFSTNMAISETKGQEWRAIIT